VTESWPAQIGDGSVLVNQVKQLQRNGTRVVIAADGTGSATRLKQSFTDNGVTPGATVVAALERGFILPRVKLAVLAEPDVTGRRRAHRAARAPKRRDSAGFFTTGTVRLVSTTAALRSEQIDLGSLTRAAAELVGERGRIGCDAMRARQGAQGVQRGVSGSRALLFHSGARTRRERCGFLYSLHRQLPQSWCRFGKRDRTSTKSRQAPLHTW